MEYICQNHNCKAGISSLFYLHFNEPLNKAFAIGFFKRGDKYNITSAYLVHTARTVTMAKREAKKGCEIPSDYSCTVLFVNNAVIDLLLFKSLMSTPKVGLNEPPKPSTEVTKKMQRLLKKLGLYSGEVDGNFNKVKLGYYKWLTLNNIKTKQNLVREIDEHMDLLEAQAKAVKQSVDSETKQKTIINDVTAEKTLPDVDQKQIDKSKKQAETEANLQETINQQDLLESQIKDAQLYFNDLVNFLKTGDSSFDIKELFQMVNDNKGILEGKWGNDRANNFSQLKEYTSKSPEFLAFHQLKNEERQAEAAEVKRQAEAAEVKRQADILNNIYDLNQKIKNISTYLTMYLQNNIISDISTDVFEKLELIESSLDNQNLWALTVLNSQLKSFISSNNLSGDYLQFVESLVIPNLLRTAKQGDSEAQFNLGVTYEKIMQDDNQALSWYIKSAKQGNARANQAAELIKDKIDKDEANEVKKIAEAEEKRKSEEKRIAADKEEEERLKNFREVFMTCGHTVAEYFEIQWSYDGRKVYQDGFALNIGTKTPNPIDNNFYWFVERLSEYKFKVSSLTIFMGMQVFTVDFNNYQSLMEIELLGAREYSNCF